MNTQQRLQLEAKVTRLINKFVRRLGLIKKTLLLGDIYWASKLIAHSIPLRDVSYDRKSGKLFLKRLNISIGKEQNLFLLRGYHWATLLANSLNAQFHINEHNEVFIGVADMEANIKTQGELFNLKEIFLDGIYNMFFLGPIVVWDIGMNVGLASLFFASHQDVVVVAFEPFNKTFDQALRNISLNPTLSDRIRALNVGLSDKRGKVYIEYNREVADQLGVYDVQKELKEGRRFEREEIVLEDARQVLDSIVADYPGRAIVAKIDCEGSEYQIIQALAAAGKLCLLEVIMMEWHILKPEHDPVALVRLLHDSNFNVFIPKLGRKTEGIIYAVRRNC